MADGFDDHPFIMPLMHLTRSRNATLIPALRFWALPILTCLLILANIIWIGLDSEHMTAIAAAMIVLAGIPHGTLDVEIAALRFGQASFAGRALIVAIYGTCALSMVLLWFQLPSLALISFLVISVVHFSLDWRGRSEPFLALMVGWALVALPALSHPQAVASIFEVLTGNEGGGIIAALLACSSIPAALGSIVFAHWSYLHGDKKIAVDVATCLIAALFLPPLIAFAIFFCGLHSPRHMADAMRETGMIAPPKKAMIILIVFALSIGLGVLLFVAHDPLSIEEGVIRAAFVLISTLTAPHFLLEQFASRHSR
jgi:Brp/Blh family beta-carotene 15,15'-monooxygenase